MFSNFTIGILLGLGFGGWVYSKTMHHNGGQAKQALLVAAIAGIIACILAVTLVGIFFHS